MLGRLECTGIVNRRHAAGESFATRRSRNAQPHFVFSVTLELEPVLSRNAVWRLVARRRGVVLGRWVVSGSGSLGGEHGAITI